MEKSYALVKGWRRDDFGNVSRANAATFSAQILPFLPPGPGVAVEIGFGNGELLVWLRNRGWHVIGIDTDLELLSRARACGFDAAPTMSEIGDVAVEGVDAVVALDVLEHIPLAELRHLVSDVKARLRPGGIFVARFPNGDSPYGRYYQHGDYTHVTTIGSGMIRQIALDNGFTIDFIGAPAPPDISIGAARWIKHRLLMLARIAHEIWASWIFFGGTRVWLSPNLFVVLRAK